ncbi:MAG TPA: fucose isomerase, partial [Candidatus Bathyarchaeota archaeon]|nr:fucose isomerase [Candidatus Bathyarchaeota archaeon]
MSYNISKVTEPKPIGENEIILVTSGDLRLSANQECWPAQKEMEEKVKEVFKKEGYKIIRGHPYDEELKHGFIWTQRMGMDVFKEIPKNARVIVAESVWQYSHHVLAGLRDHRGPILTLANWSGQWPGLVGMLNLNASLTKMGVDYSTIWSKDFDDEFFLTGIREWLKTGKITHDISHARPLDPSNLPEAEKKLGEALAAQLRSEKAVMGI